MHEDNNVFKKGMTRASLQSVELLNIVSMTNADKLAKFLLNGKSEHLRHVIITDFNFGKSRN